MHSPNATWETSLVIPETAKPIDQQTLDALLRIEELLKYFLVLLPAQEPTKEPEDRGNYEDRHTPDTTKPRGKRK